MVTDYKDYHVSMYSLPIGQAKEKPFLWMRENVSIIYNNIRDEENIKYYLCSSE